MTVSERFIVPAAGAQSSGGNRYNDGFLAALGASAERFEPEAALRALRAGEPGFYWLDTLYLAHWSALRAIAPLGALGLLVHYLPSLVEHRGEIRRELLSEAERSALDRADALLVTSCWMREALERLVPDPQRLLVVEPGREPAPGLQPAPPATGMRALLVAHLVPGKGVVALLRALARELDGADPLELSVIGAPRDPAYAAECHALVANDPKLARVVTFAGELAPAGVLARMAESNVLLSSSHFEAYGMALAEARSVGLPIVARAGGNAGALVGPATGGELCPDDGALATALLRLCRDPALHAERLERAQRTRLAPRPWSEAARDFNAQRRCLRAGERCPLAANGTTNEMREQTTR